MTGSSAVAGSVLCNPGPVRWHALYVSAQKEEQAEAWLARRGVYGFHPVTIRKTRRAGKARQYHRRYLPGYVFARFPGEAIAHAVTACPFVHGALSRWDGSWGVLNPGELRSLHAMRSIDIQLQVADRAEERRQRRVRNLKKGDRAMFKSGPFVDHSCEVVELNGDGGVKVSVQLFGREVLTVSAAEDLVAVHRTA